VVYLHIFRGSYHASLQFNRRILKDNWLSFIWRFSDREAKESALQADRVLKFFLRVGARGRIFLVLHKIYLTECNKK
jgi:hypothetical protein